ncbi:MAG: crosslink repair DNA glycosylase YcaQ family protein [Nocardioides sp.]
MAPQTLSRAQARRVALLAQGFARTPAAGPGVDSGADSAAPTLATLRRTLRHTGVLQIDSVNVLERAHYLPLYSRMGPYDKALLTRASERSPRQLVEYWAHVAAFMPVDLWPVMQHRMQRIAANDRWWQRVREKPEVLASVRAALRSDGAATARQLDDGAPRRRDHWGWNWSATKDALEYLFFTGEVAIAGRNSAFERRYDLPERVLPRAVLEAPVPTPEEAELELVRRAARSHGIGTVNCLADYYRMGVAETRRAVATLCETGELREVSVEGWTRPAFMHHEARVPRAITARTLLSPFDPLVWERARTESLFEFHYRIEIYTPAAKRRYGYYVLPFLLGDRIVARTDLKADRARGVLLVQGAYAESAAPPETAAELAAELARLARWQGLTGIEVAERGDLALPLRAHVGH